MHSKGALKMLYLMQMLYYLIPVAAIVFFVVSLWLYLAARKRNKQQPGAVRAGRLKWLKWQLIVASAVVGVLVAVLIVFVFLLFMAVAFM